jgi:Cholesterol oxidase, substrate-binding
MCTDVIAVHLGRSASDLWGPSKNSLLYGKKTTTRLTTNGYAVHIRRSEIQEAVHDFTVKVSVLLQAYANNSKWAINGPVEIRGRASMIPQQRRIAPRVDRQQPADIWSRVSSANTLFRPGTVSPVLPPPGRRCWCAPFRHRSRRVVTGGRGRPGCCPPPRSSPVGSACGRTLWGQGTGLVQRGHRTCVSISCSQRPWALPGHGTGLFHWLHGYHLDVSGTIKEASGLCPERSVVGDDRGYRPLPSVSRQVTRGHVS